MIWVILLACIGLIMLGAWLLDKLSYDLEWLGGGTVILGIFGSVATFIAAVVLIVCCSNTTVIDEKIAMYTEENTKIEQQMADAVEAYQKHETDVFTNVKSESAVTLVSMYPELKSDTLVQSQLEVYVANSEMIKVLKVDKISAGIYRWWLYFGR